MFCIKCGKENSDKNKFCIGCGAELKKPSVNNNATFEQNFKEDNTFEINDVNNGFDTSHNVLGSDSATTVLGQDIGLKLVDQNGQTYQVETLPCIVGKGSAADLIIPGDESISRKHICIHEYGENEFVIEDLKSTNKTFLNNAVINNDELIILNDGDKIKLGTTTLVVSID